MMGIRLSYRSTYINKLNALTWNDPKIMMGWFLGTREKKVNDIKEASSAVSSTNLFETASREMTSQD